MEVRLFNIDAAAYIGRKICVSNTHYILVAEWDCGIPFAELLMDVGAKIPLGSIGPRGMKFMEYLAKN
jgi:hypothetical protein